MGVGESDLFWTGCMNVGECGWLWVSVTLFWLVVGECDLFLAGCRWVWVSVTFLAVCG